MTKDKKQELVIFLIIVGVATFFRLYQLDHLPTLLYPNEVLPRVVSAIVGILSVIGLYLFVKELFEWQLAAIASFLMAISFWPVNFSRMGSEAIIIPFILVYAFYFIWKGLKRGHLTNFVIAGIFGGLGFYTDISYRMALIVIMVVFVNYWLYLKKDFAHSKYEHTKIKLLQGFVLFAFSTILIALPIGPSFWKHIDDFFSMNSSTTSLFSQSGPIKYSADSIVGTLGMFNFTGDWNQQHNIPGSPMLPWPIGVFFAVGFINELIHWLKRKHGHFSTTHTLLFAWFFIMLVPGFLSTQVPNALLTIGVLPIVMIFTARGVWWFFKKLSSWYSANNTHSEHEAHAITAMVMIVFLFSIGFMEYWRYFRVWGPSPETAAALKHNIKK